MPADPGLPVLRPAGPQDADRVAQIWHTGWHDAHPGHVPDGLTQARTPAAFTARAARAVEATTVAEVAGELAGFVMVVGDEVEQVYVARGWRGSGAADVLLAEAERQVAAAGHAQAWLAVVTGNSRARRFYERAGWRDTGPLDYEVTAGGQRFVSPCRRYVKDLFG
ncbi:MAG TPA: GNAT family N-acetyltransferase [Actinotalea sp.]|mgnify:CR=1 FL=1|nr:GNAT family N-acetyltransferase [Actinotalea sp.]